MKKSIRRCVIALIAAIGISIPVYGEEIALPEDQMQMTPEQLQEKKDKGIIPNEINEKITAYVQSERDIWSLIAFHLDLEDYGGIYTDDGILYIKLLQSDMARGESNGKKTVEEILSYVPQRTRSAQENIVYEYDAVYTMKQLEQASDTLLLSGLDIYGIGIDDRNNGLNVEAESWDETKKQAVIELSGLDASHIQFSIVHLVDENTEKATAGDYPPAMNDAMPGSPAYKDDSSENRPYTIGSGVYYEIDNVTTDNGKYGWVTAGHFTNIGDTEIINLGEIGAVHLFMLLQLL